MKRMMLALLALAGCGGSGGGVVAPEAVGTQAEALVDVPDRVFRLFREGKGHFYTSSASEARFAVATLGMTLEGSRFNLARDPIPGTAPLFRYFLPAINRHLYTTSPNCEGAPGCRPEGLMGHIAIANCPGAVPLQRMYRPTDGDHFYTTSSSEVAFALGDGYHVEGTAGSVWPPRIRPDCE
jgi:hypothetical protein